MSPPRRTPPSSCGSSRSTGSPWIRPFRSSIGTASRGPGRRKSWTLASQPTIKATVEGIVRDLVGRLLLERFVAAALRRHRVPFKREEEYRSLAGQVDEVAAKVRAYLDGDTSVLQWLIQFRILQNIPGGQPVPAPKLVLGADEMKEAELDGTD